MAEEESVARTAAHAVSLAGAARAASHPLAVLVGGVIWTYAARRGERAAGEPTS